MTGGTGEIEQDDGRAADTERTCSRPIVFGQGNGTVGYEASLPELLDELLASQLLELVLKISFLFHDILIVSMGCVERCRTV